MHEQIQQKEIGANAGSGGRQSAYNGRIRLQRRLSIRFMYRKIFIPYYLLRVYSSCTPEAVSQSRIGRVECGGFLHGRLMIGVFQYKNSFSFINNLLFHSYILNTIRFLTLQIITYSGSNGV